MRRREGTYQAMVGRRIVRQMSGYRPLDKTFFVRILELSIMLMCS